MISVNDALKVIEERLKEMSFEERETYLKKIGFSFGEAPETPASKGRVLRYSSPELKKVP